MYDSAAEHAGCGLLCGAIHGADCMYDSAAEHVNADRREEERDRTAGQSDEDEKQLPAGRLRGPPRRGLFLSGAGERCGDFGNPPKGLHKKGKTSNNMAIHDGYLYEFPTGKENM